jgi:hypothetical protein
LGKNINQTSSSEEQCTILHNNPSSWGRLCVRPNRLRFKPELIREISQIGIPKADKNPVNA